MNNAISCPKCHTIIEVTQVMRSQLSDQIRQELASEAAIAQAELEKTRAALTKERKGLDEQRKNLAEEVRQQVETGRQKLLSQAREQAKAELTVELRDRDQQVSELQQKLKQAQQEELALRKRERELQSKTDELKLEVERQLQAERDGIRQAALQQADQDHQLKNAEKDKQIADMRQQIDLLKRKAEQGSQQLQGEVQETALEEQLQTAFPTDSISPIAKGVNGGDSLQQVLDQSGTNCGTILWESKRTKKWSNSWLSKLREDQRNARAACAVIVSETLPPGVASFDLVDGVWVCSWACVRPLAAALRTVLMEVAKSRLAVQGQHGKMEMLYNYLSSQEFRNRVTGMVEAIAAMQVDLISEKRSMQRIWSKREKQIERAIAHTAGMYGDLQGIVGRSLPEIKGLTLGMQSTCDTLADIDLSIGGEKEYQLTNDLPTENILRDD